MGQKNKITREDIANTMKEVFNFIDPTTRRFINGRRGCITRGNVDIYDFSHCGDETCPSCNMVNKAFKDEIKAQLENYKTKGQIENEKL